MITAIDTSALLDVFLPDPKFADASRRAIDSAYAAGSLVICEPVYAELASCFTTQTQLDSVLRECEIRVEAIGRDAAFLAGRMFRRYRDTGGNRERVITDFLIGAHASLRASRLLTRDRGFYGSNFATLAVLDPSQALS